jgi:hypothetical protein
MNHLRAAQSLHECKKNNHTFNASNLQVLLSGALPGHLSCALLNCCRQAWMSRPAMLAGKDFLPVFSPSVTVAVF